MTHHSDWNCKADGHWFPSSFKSSDPRPQPGEACLVCEVIFCPVAYDHDEDSDGCEVCGWENEGGAWRR